MNLPDRRIGLKKRGHLRAAGQIDPSAGQSPVQAAQAGWVHDGVTDSIQLEAEETFRHPRGHGAVPRLPESLLKLAM
jgi:hypothetical protein